MDELFVWIGRQAALGVDQHYPLHYFVIGELMWFDERA